MNKDEIIDKIKNKFWDLIIYGKVGPDEFCDFPLYETVKMNYNKNKIVFIFGGDENFNLKNENEKYSNYLNYFKDFGTCFVREFEK